VALGSGDLGRCRAECYTTPCASGDGCHYVDDTAQKGQYKGVVCLPESSSPSDVGGVCITSDECVSGAECIDDNGGIVGTCRALCQLGSVCDSGARCSNFATPGPVGYCPQ
jgi:hypothetical protein